MNSEDSTQWGSLLPAHSVYPKYHGKNFCHPQRRRMLCCGLGLLKQLVSSGSHCVPGLFPFIQGCDK